MPTEFEKRKQRHASAESSGTESSLTAYIPTPPDGGYGWVIVLASFLNHVIVDGIAFTYQVFYLPFKVEFNTSNGNVALVGSLLCGMYLLTGPIAGALVNKYGCRSVCIVGGLITSLSFVLSTMVTSIGYMMFTYGILGGFGFGLIYLPSVISVSYYFEKKRALATGIAVCGAGAGCFIFAPLGNLLLETFDWKNSLLIVAGVVLNSVLCGLLLKPLEAPDMSKKPRKKNLIDRILERAKKHVGFKRRDSVVVNHEIRAKRVEQVKLARQRACESECNSEMGSLPACILQQRCDTLASQARIRQASIAEAKCLRENPNDEVESDDDCGTSLSDGELGIATHADPVTTPATTPATTHAAKNQNRDKPPTVGSRQARHSLAARLSDQLSGNGGRTGHVGVAESMPVVNVANCMDGAVDTDKLMVNGVKQTCKVATSENNMSTQSPVRRRHLSAAPTAVNKEDYSRPLYRKDIFYSGSVYNIAAFQKSKQDVHTSYAKSITSIPRIDEVQEKTSCLDSCMPKVASDVLRDMMDITLLRNPMFTIVCLGNVFGMIGMYIPFIFIADKAEIAGIDKSNSIFLLSVIGITNTLGRIASGWVADLKCINTLLLHNMAVLVAGLLCICSMFCSSYTSFCAYAALFGLCIATWISLTSIILCEMIGVEKLTNAFGLLAMARGASVIAGPPLAGWVLDATNNIDNAFHVGGTMMLIAGSLFMLLHLPYFRHSMATDDLCALESGLPVFESSGIAIEIIDADKEAKECEKPHRHYQQHTTAGQTHATVDNHAATGDVLRSHSVGVVSRELGVAGDEACVVHSSDSGHLEVDEVVAEISNDSYITLETPTPANASSAISLPVIIENENTCK